MRIAPKIPNDAIVALARRQHRNVTRAQLLALGLSSDAIKRRVSHGWMHREHLGVYAVGTPANTPVEHAAAAVLACGDGAALSHGSALALWGLAKRWPIQPHVTVRRDRRPRGIAVHLASSLTRADLRTHLGIRVTSVARALLDCAPTLTSKALTRTVNDALRSPYLTHAQLTDVCRRLRNHPGTGRLVPFVQTPAGPTRSEFEDAFLGFCERFGLPRPLVNTVVCGYEVDAFFAAERVIVELDGWDFHNSRTSFEGDRDRDADTLAARIVTVRITWERLTERPHQEARRLSLILSQRRAPPN